jgi:hypothetical protein
LSRSPQPRLFSLTLWPPLPLPPPLPPPLRVQLVAP